jgi:hypothetical protein
MARLELDDPALYRDGNGMCAIVGAQLGKYVGDVVLDRCFSDAQLVRDYLVGIACGNQPKHIDFARGQLVVTSVFS